MTKASDEAIEEIENDIPLIYLVRCAKPAGVENGKIEEVIAVLQINAERAKQCRLIHNQLVEHLSDQNNGTD